MSDFGATLRLKRRDAGLSQRRLADHAGLDYSYISKLENGRLPAPAAATIVRLAVALDCSPDELLSAAGKLPVETLKLSEQPAAVRFLREASQAGLIETEWEELSTMLKGIRDSRGSDGCAAN